MSQLVINNLHVDVDGKEILKGINLTINEHERHALMGPNGNGKSTLLAAIMGNPIFHVSEGSIELDGKDVLSMSVDERARAGLFLGMQYPSEISGVTNADFLRAAINARLDKPVSLFRFIKDMENSLKKMEMKSDLAHRFLNEGFSGGEKKRNEIVQMMMLKPSIAMLDEIDSGLDVDALNIVANAIKEMFEKQSFALLVISHYARFLKLLEPTHVHVLIDGKIVMSDDASLIDKIDQDGFDWIEKACGVKAVKEENKQVVLLSQCGANKGV